MFEKINRYFRGFVKILSIISRVIYGRLSARIQQCMVYINIYNTYNTYFYLQTYSTYIYRYDVCVHVYRCMVCPMGTYIVLRKQL